MESVIRTWVELFEAKDFEGVADLYTDPFDHQGRTQTREEHVAFMKQMTGMFPSHTNELDVIVVNRDEPSQGKVAVARLIGSQSMDPAGAALFGIDLTGPPVPTRIQDFFFARFEDGGDPEKPKIKELYSMIDIPALYSQMADPQTAVFHSNSEDIRSQVTPATQKHDLADILRRWTAHVAANTFVENAPEFVREKAYLTSTGLVDRADFVAGLAAIRANLGDLEFEPAFLAVDLKKQQVAVRNIMKTVLVKPVAGIEPNGKSVTISDYCIYQFVDGKIFAVWSTVDMMGLKQQMAA